MVWVKVDGIFADSSFKEMAFKNGYIKLGGRKGWLQLLFCPTAMQFQDFVPYAYFQPSGETKGELYLIKSPAKLQKIEKEWVTDKLVEFSEETDRSIYFFFERSGKEGRWRIATYDDGRFATAKVEENEEGKIEIIPWEVIEKRWREEGWENGREAENWYDNGWKDPGEALKWKNAGWDDPRDAYGWREGGNLPGFEDPAEALKWRKAWEKMISEFSYLDIDLITEWREAGWQDPVEASKWCEAGWSEPDLALAWHEAGWKSPRKALEMYKKGYEDPEEALKALFEQHRHQNRRPHRRL